jgi:hypothetical protein
MFSHVNHLTCLVTIEPEIIFVQANIINLNSINRVCKIACTTVTQYIPPKIKNEQPISMLFGLTSYSIASLVNIKAKLVTLHVIFAIINYRLVKFKPILIFSVFCFIRCHMTNFATPL